MEFPDKVDVTKPSVARVYDALLGGKDNFDVDRQAVERMRASAPMGEETALPNRAWLGRAVRWLASEADIDQFIDLGSGLPTVLNVHEIAQKVRPDATVIYVDNDPAVAAYGRALLEDNDRSFLVAADLTEPEELLNHPTVTEHIDLTRPTALVQSFTMHFVPDQADAERIMATYVEGLPKGSYVALSHLRVPDPDDHAANATVLSYQESVSPITPRPVELIEALFVGLELVEPGLVCADDWWPAGPELTPRPHNASYAMAGVARKGRSDVA